MQNESDPKRERHLHSLKLGCHRDSAIVQPPLLARLTPPLANPTSGGRLNVASNAGSFGRVFS